MNKFIKSEVYRCLKNPVVIFLCVLFTFYSFFIVDSTSSYNLNYIECIIDIFNNHYYFRFLFFPMIVLICIIDKNKIYNYSAIRFRNKVDFILLKHIAKMVSVLAILILNLITAFIICAIFKPVSFKYSYDVLKVAEDKEIIFNVFRNFSEYPVISLICICLFLLAGTNLLIFIICFLEQKMNRMYAVGFIAFFYIIQGINDLFFDISILRSQVLFDFYMYILSDNVTKFIVGFLMVLPVVLSVNKFLEYRSNLSIFRINRYNHIIPMTLIMVLITCIYNFSKLIGKNNSVADVLFLNAYHPYIKDSSAFIIMYNEIIFLLVAYSVLASLEYIKDNLSSFVKVRFRDKRIYNRMLYASAIRFSSMYFMVYMIIILLACIIQYFVSGKVKLTDEIIQSFMIRNFNYMNIFGIYVINYLQILLVITVSVFLSKYIKPVIASGIIFVLIFLSYFKEINLIFVGIQDFLNSSYSELIYIVGYILTIWIIKKVMIEGDLWKR